MVASAARDDTCFFDVAQLGEFVHGAADFECSGPLQVLSFEHDFAAKALAEIGGRDDRRV